VGIRVGTPTPVSRWATAPTLRVNLTLPVVRLRTDVTVPSTLPPSELIRTVITDVRISHVASVRESGQDLRATPGDFEEPARAPTADSAGRIRWVSAAVTKTDRVRHRAKHRGRPQEGARQPIRGCRRQLVVVPLVRDRRSVDRDSPVCSTVRIRALSVSDGSVRETYSHGAAETSGRTTPPCLRRNRRSRSTRR